MRVFSLMIIILFGAAFPAQAWSKEGHQLVCNIAFGMLDSDVRQEVDRLLDTIDQKNKRKLNKFFFNIRGNGPDPRLDSRITFEKACVWADAVRRSEIGEGLGYDFENSESWHFQNILRDEDQVSINNCMVGCASQAIRLHYNVMKAAVTDQQKLFSMMFLGHWVGDIHQPLHVSFADDAGGNFIETLGVNCSNIHALWDRCIIDHNTKNMSFEDKADLLRQIPTATQVLWRRAREPEEWANESLAITLLPETQYCENVQGRCEKLPVNADGKLVLQGSYRELHWPRVQRRIQMAAVRLADMLNRVL